MANEIQKINSGRTCNHGAVAFPPVLKPNINNMDNYNVVTKTFIHTEFANNLAATGGLLDVHSQSFLTAVNTGGGNITITGVAGQCVYIEDITFFHADATTPGPFTITVSDGTTSIVHKGYINDAEIAGIFNEKAYFAMGTNVTLTMSAASGGSITATVRYKLV